MYLTTKYSKLYNSIVDKAKNRTIEGYTESHHIYPRSLGGTNDRDNLVQLTAREHFICHWLLIKMTEGDARSKMIYALHNMKAQNRYQERYETKITSRVYEKYRMEHATNHSKIMKGRIPPNKGRKMSEEQKQLLRERAKANHASGKIYLPESQHKRLLKLKNFKHSEETKQKQRQSQLGKSKGPLSEAHRKAISEKIRGKPKKEGHAENVRAAVLGSISINKDGIEKKIKRDILDQYLQQGWKLGGRKRKAL